MTDKQYKGYKIEGVGKGKADYYVYTDLCKGCGLCIAKCPMNKAGKKCLQWSKEVGLYQTPAVAPDPEICIACGACAMTCPDSAIRIEKRQQIKKEKLNNFSFFYTSASASEAQSSTFRAQLLFRPSLSVGSAVGQYFAFT